MRKIGICHAEYAVFGGEIVVDNMCGNHLKCCCEQQGEKLKKRSASYSDGVDTHQDSTIGGKEDTVKA